MGRRLGQHFLVRESILEKIAAAVCGEHTATVVEIGPGKGALTRRLLDRSDRVVAIEVDPYLVGYLRQRFHDHHRLTIVESDVLKTDLGQWGQAAVAGNLPYYITSPIVSHLFSTPGWQQAVFLVQKEVAERMTATPGSRDYGYLTVQVSLNSHAELLFPVSRAADAPPPKVESAVLRLTPRESGITDRAAFLAFASLAFGQKRKTLRNNLRAMGPAIDGMPEAGLRAEQVGLEDLVRLYQRLSGQAPG